MLMGLQTLRLVIDFSEVGERGGVWKPQLFIKYLERCANSKDKRDKQECKYKYLYYLP